VTGRLPAAIRAMTPEETILFTQGWNAAQSGGLDPPDRDEVMALMEQYPDGE